MAGDSGKALTPQDSCHWVQQNTKQKVPGTYGWERDSYESISGGRGTDGILSN